MEIDQLAGAIEAILFVSGESVDPEMIKSALKINDMEMNAALHLLEERLMEPRSGLQLKEFKGKLQLTTNPAYATAIRDVLNPVQKQSLSQSALETLAIIAYEQPVTRARLEAVRGVKCDYATQVLVARGLIEEVGRLEALGRPILYGTTEEFLRHFGLRSLEELPPLQEDFAKQNVEEPQSENTQSI